MLPASPSGVRRRGLAFDHQSSSIVDETVPFANGVNAEYGARAERVSAEAGVARETRAGRDAILLVMRSLAWAPAAAALAALAAPLAACVGDDPAPLGPSVTDDGGGGDGGGGGDAGGPGEPVGDSGVNDSGSGCTSTCDGDTLRACREGAGGVEEIPCPLGCSATPSAHCKAVRPSPNGVTPADLDDASLAEIAIIANTTIDSDTGEIAGVRAANADPAAREVIAGIGFRQATIPGANGAKIGIFSFDALTIGDGRTLLARGTNAIALVVAREMTILGILDGRGPCTTTAGGPGGGRGGSIAGLAGGGGGGTAGASNQSYSISGGGGGGYGDNGGKTLQAGVGQSTLGGLPYGNASLVPLRGGSGGGRGGDANTATPTGGTGGGGGGALHLVAGSQITIGGGSTRGGINAGGCGGKGAAIPAQNLSGAGGGGGSGGAVLIEAPVVRLGVDGYLAVNGGAGGGGATGSSQTAQAGDSGKLAYFQANAGTFGGAAAGSGCGGGGFGGASDLAPSTLKGQDGATGGIGGGAGGGVGRVRVNTASGAMQIVNATARVSPDLGDLNSHGDPVSTQGTLAIE